jgi:diguanylate cyclase (GGDEF)-like protein
VHYDLGNDESALEMFEQALLLATDEALKLRLRGNIAAISIELGRLEQAIEVQAQILASPNATNLANTHSNMALALHRMSDQQLESGQETKAQELLEQAKHHIQMALQLSRASNEQDTEGHTLVTLAGIFKHQGNFSQAFVHCQEALVLAQSAGYPWVELQARISLGVLEQRQGRYLEAKIMLEQALKRAEELGFQEQISRIHFNLSEVLESLGDYQKALQHHRRFYELDLTVRSEAASKRVEALTVRFQVERAQLEAQLQRERSEALVALNQQLEHQALTDPLTGLANRRAFTEHYKRTFAAAKESGSALSVVMIDLDHFKRVNDQFSHAVGDDVLKAFAKILQEHCRATDLAARYGGEEFVLLMPGVEARATFNACERLRVATQTFDWSKIQAGLQVTASFGFGDVLQALDHVALLEMADQQLYSAKNAGRNQIQPSEF